MAGLGAGYGGVGGLSYGIPQQIRYQEINSASVPLGVLQPYTGIGIAGLGAYGGGLGLGGYGGYGGGIVGIPVLTGGNLILGGGLGTLGGGFGALGGLGGLGGNLGLGGYGGLRGGLLRREDRALDDAGTDVSDIDADADNQQETTTI